MAPVRDVSALALRRFKVVWTLSWVVKLAVLFAFLAVVVMLTGGHL